MVASTAGGSPDTIVRTIGRVVEAQLGQNLIIDNRGGANGIIGTELTAKSLPDGHTFLIVGNGFRSSSGLFLQPMTLANGWSRETFSTAIALQHIFWGLSGPFFGAMADKYGPGRTMTIGALLMSLGYWGMSHSQTSTELILSAGLLIGSGFGGAGLAMVLSVFARSVDASRRSMVFGIGTAAGSMG